MNKSIEKLNEPVVFVCTIILYYFYVKIVKQLLKNLFKSQKKNKSLAPYFSTAWLGLLIVIPMTAVGIYGFQNKDHPRNVMNMAIVITGFILVGCYDYLSCLRKNNKVRKSKSKRKSKVNNSPKTNTNTSSTITPVPKYKMETSIPVPINDTK